MPTTAPKAAKPTKNIFDAFNSSSTGHQRAENRLSGSTLWRDSRHLKLRNQFKSNAGGGERISDTVGAGSDGSVKMGLTEQGQVTWFRSKDQQSLQESLKITKDVERPAKRAKLNNSADRSKKEDAKTPLKKAQSTDKTSPTEPSPSDFLSPIDPGNPIWNSPYSAEDENQNEHPPEEKPCPQIFANTVVYINGSTAPVVSDHRLKHILTKHGAKLSIALGRRSVTHVILGRPNSSGGSGGGLSGSKIQKEISGKRLEDVRYVTVDWVLESVKAGKRLSEMRFEALRFAPKGVGSVANIFQAHGKDKDKEAPKGGNG